MIHSQRENARYLKAFDNNWDVEIKKKNQRSYWKYEQAPLQENTDLISI